MFFHVLSLCLYLCTRASGGLILIARQASKCLCHCVLFFASDITDWYTVQLCMAINHKQICYSDFSRQNSASDIICSLVFWPLMSPFCCRMFGFVARRTGSATENVCHLFAEMDPEQPAVAIVNFINKVMLGPQIRRWESRRIWQLWTIWGSGGDVNMTYFLMKCVCYYICACICTGGTTVLGCMTVFTTESSSDRSLLCRAKYCLSVYRANREE